jgi:hypothetical protein
MKRRILVIALVAAGIAAPAWAAIIHPKQAKQIKVNFVTAYQPCATGPLQHRPPILDVLQSCAPALTTINNPLHQITFGPSGSAMALVKVVNGDVQIKFKAKHVLDNGTPFGGVLVADVVLRVSDHACGPPTYTTPCTVADVDLSSPVQLIKIGCTAGTCNGTFLINTLVPGLIAVGDEGNVELSQFVIKDPDGDVCFRQGLFLP